MSLLGKRWKILQDDAGKPVLKKLLEARGFSELPSNSAPLEQLHDPYLMHDLERACERLELAKERGEKVVVFGDYDVDGVTATAVLVRTLHKLGITVSYRIPHRVRDGYSLKNYFLDELAALGVTLVITVDNGIAAAREIAHAIDLGMDIIVTDHHTPPPKDELPTAHSILNPKMEGCTYPCKELSGSAVAMKLCLALVQRNMPEGEARDAFCDRLYQVAGIGIVADCMQLVGENRSIVQLCLNSIRRNPLKGVEALLTKAGIDHTTVRAADISFAMAPRLNAAGRLDSAYDALHLFLNQSDAVTTIAHRLDVLNVERRTMTQDAFHEAQLAMMGADEKIAIVLGEHWPPGVIGLVASRLVDALSIPAIVFAKKGDEYVASCRSIAGFDMVAELRIFADMFEHFGGHAMAAGLSIRADRFPLFKEAMQVHARHVLQDRDLTPVLLVDTDILPHELTLETIESMSALEPFGLGNPEPLFLLRQVRPMYVRAVGADKSHLSFSAEGIKGIAFRMGQHAPTIEGKLVDIVLSLDVNTWQGKSSAQMIVRDMLVHN
ncbi:single-stranded-DNA-specific exonuclease RecJ [Candidatus Gracilibacteria bacterium CG17_big_fil_post_rev_8_21_14_2_50_48_13]|nr:MAG: single-stranded-DNA-specific exonuclease RecJ [Candidatus Gracilibacteria bacterium CG17_big_fil_post_rev_8_21_14_2_50_48_13]